MLLYKSEQEEGAVLVETKVYISDSYDRVILGQYLFKGTEVVSCSEVDLSMQQFASISTLASQAYVENFLGSYSLDDK